MLVRSALIGVVLLIFGSSAGAFCSEPDAPYCASRYGAFDDEYEFDRCKREMESYQSEVEDFISCLKREIEDLNRKGNQAVDDYTDAVTSFNRRARG